MEPLIRFVEDNAPRLEVFAAQRGEHAISPLLFGKFTEHLGRNVYHGIWAQVKVVDVRQTGIPNPTTCVIGRFRNELWGDWQIGHCTHEEYAERYRRFVQAMKAVDPTIEIIACGQDAHWNEPLIERCADILRSLSIHTLIAHSVPADVPVEQAYRSIAAFPVWYEGHLITHSALMNHGGGLRMHREYVWKNPVQLAHEVLVNPAGRVPVGLTVAAPFFPVSALHDLPAVERAPYLDAVAAVNASGSELSLLVTNRHPDSALTADIVPHDFKPRAAVATSTLAEDTPTARNSFEQPEAVRIVKGEAGMGKGECATPSRRCR